MTSCLSGGLSSQKLVIFSLPVVDVVRTDSHLEFYEDTKNLARMSDILAVYAWVDPATGYCQGFSFVYVLIFLQFGCEVNLVILFWLGLAC